MKKFYESKTFWFNMLFLLGVVASLFGFADFSPSKDVIEVAAVLASVINLILRVYTEQKISL